MKRTSPPKHRHDGTSPLPLGMDWSPPPKKWDGRNTVWPHDPHTGWSYCVMVPSWIVQTESKASNDSSLNPIVFYRIQVGIQSPEGVSSIHGILRRFSDFLKLYSALKRTFPKKDIPPAPPKHALLRINSSRLLLEERRRALDEWMGKLLSDIDLSRSAPVAAFIELEVAARSSFQDASQLSLKTDHLAEAFVSGSSLPERSGSNASLAGSLAFDSNSRSMTSDIGCDNACETSDTGTFVTGMIHASASGVEAGASALELSSSTGEISNGILRGESVLGRPEEFLRINLQHGKENLSVGRDASDGNSSKEMPLSRERTEYIPGRDHDKLSGHSRKHSTESIGSDVSSLRGSELSIPGVSNSMWDGSVELNGGDTRSALEALSSMDTQFLNDSQVLLPLDERHKLNRALVTMQRRLATAKTDMEDLIARLNQEMTVKEYLTTKVKDLEGELEVTKQKGKENLQQAILVERERITQMQWEMDELRRKHMEMEAKLKFEESEKTRAESEKSCASGENDLLLQELDSKQEQIDKLQRHIAGVEMKSKADIKVLVKEVKFLRGSQAELKEMLNQSIKEKTELERVLQTEKQRLAHLKSMRKKLLHECEVLCHRLRECSVNFLSEEEDKFTVTPSSLSDALDLLETSDNRISLLLAEAQLLAHDDDEPAIADAEKSKSTYPSENLIMMNGDDPVKSDNEVRRMLTDMLIDNARLRKQVNAVIRCAFKTLVEPEKDGEVPSRKTILNRFLER